MLPFLLLAAGFVEVEGGGGGVAVADILIMVLNLEECDEPILGLLTNLGVTLEIGFTRAAM